MIPSPENLMRELRQFSGCAQAALPAAVVKDDVALSQIPKFKSVSEGHTFIYISSDAELCL